MANLFTIENQRGNSISRSTSQSIIHPLQKAVQVSISGMENRPDGYSIWIRTPRRAFRQDEDLTLEEAVRIANKILEDTII